MIVDKAMKKPTGNMSKPVDDRGRPWPSKFNMQATNESYELKKGDSFELKKEDGNPTIATRTCCCTLPKSRYYWGKCYAVSCSIHISFFQHYQAVFK